MKTKKSLLNIARSGLVIAGTVLFLNSSGQTTNNPNFKDWDKDNNNLISRNEFVDRYSNDYSKDWKSDPMNDQQNFDKNEPVENQQSTMNEGSDRFNDNDFYESSYRIWDKNKDNRLSEDEWRYGYDMSYGDYLDDDYAGIDTNHDGYLDYNEYHNSLGNTSYYSDMDVNRDNSLDNKEVSDMVFNDWDKDSSGYIEADEYDEYGDSFLNFNDYSH